MKLIIQVPCFNEEESLPVSIPPLPRAIVGIDKVEVLIIDDGSTDNTRTVAKELGVDHIVGFPMNKGLAKGFMLGLHSCLERGADIIVNTDADNQYDASCIPKLIEPILNGTADMVVGERPITNHKEFSLIKKILQKIGSKVVRFLSGTEVQDAPSGFRAFSRDAALQLNVHSGYSYTMETLIQAGRKNLNVISVPIEVNPFLRPSRLFSNMYSYVKKSLLTIMRSFIIYNSFSFFMALGISMTSAAVLIGVRFLYYYFNGLGGGKVQSLILGSSLGLAGLVVIMFGFLSDLISTNRHILENIQYVQRKEKFRRKEDQTKNAA